MERKRGYVPIYVCATMAVVTFVYSVGASVYLSGKVNSLKSEGARAQAQATDRQTESIKEQTRVMKELSESLKEFAKVMRP